MLNDWLKLNGSEADLKKRVKDAEVALDAQAYAKYPMDGEITALEAKLAKTRQLKQGMMQELLTGKIRLPVDKARRDCIDLVHTT